MRLQDIIAALEEIAPPDYAMPGDPIGLHIGDPGQDVRRVIVTVDVTPTVAAESVRRSADLLIAHHPLIYLPLPSIRSDIYPQSVVYALVNAATAVYSMHTNFDAADGGINDVLADRLGVADAKVLQPTYTDKMFKLATFVPVEAVDSVRDAIAEAGGGVIGKYDHCSFQSPGAGTFKPMAGAQPYSGVVGELASEPELRLEMLVPEDRLHDAISEMLAAHPYEEVAYDVYPLWNRGREYGIGRYGRLLKPMSFDGFCEMVRDVLEVEDTRIVGDPEARVETVAVVGGAGGDLIPLAKSKGVDAIVTGDVRHREFIQAQALRINAIDATHFGTERPGMIALASKLHDLLSPQGATVEYLDDIILNKA
jgi:dinuclear metal center YbgI/SA1388 family protein